MVKGIDTKGVALSVRGNPRGLGNSRYLFPVLLLLLVGGAVPLLVGVMNSIRSIPSSGTVKAIDVGVYNNSACTTPLTLIQWGTLEPGSSQNKTIYVKNIGNYALTLSLNTSNWSPDGAKNYIGLTWNYVGQVLSQDQSIQLVLTLTVYANITGVPSFTFDIIIMGTG